MVANLFFFFLVGNLLNDILFQMCELGIFDVNSRKKWAVMLWNVESLPFLGHALRAKPKKKTGRGAENAQEGARKKAPVKAGGCVGPDPSPATLCSGPGSSALAACPCLPRSDLASCPAELRARQDHSWGGMPRVS